MDLATIEQEIKQLKEAELELALAKERALRDKKLELFMPHGVHQHSFFKHHDKYIRYGFCGNRFGKSTIGVVEDCSWLLGERIFYPVDSPLRRGGIPGHGVKGLLIAEDWDKVREIFTEDKDTDRPGKFIEFLPKSSIKDIDRHAQSGAIKRFIIENTIGGRKRTSTLVIETVQSYKNNPKSLESSDWDFIHVDEPLPESMWKAVARGLVDREGKSWWLVTLLTEQWMRLHAEDDCRDHPEDHWMFEATMDDNPLLSEKAKERYFNSLTEEEKQCRREGKPFYTARLVFRQFDEKKHVWQKDKPPEDWVSWSVPPPNYMKVYALDPHPQTPNAVLFIAVSPKREIFIYDEIYDPCPWTLLAKQINARRRLVGGFEYELCDPWVWQLNPDTKRAWIDTLSSYGLGGLTQGSKAKAGGIIDVNNLLSSPRPVYVFPHLVNFLREVRTWYFDKDNKPIDTDDHMMENFRRLVQHENLHYWKPRSTYTPIPTATGDQFLELDFSLAGNDSYNFN